MIVPTVDGYKPDGYHSLSDTILELCSDHFPVVFASQAVLNKDPTDFTDSRSLPRSLIISLTNS